MCSHCEESGEGGAPEQVGAEDAGGDDWAIVARFANAAEAGYFANELEYALGVEPRLDCRDDFEAVHHHWRSGFVLSVPGSHAVAAHELLRRLLDPESSHAVEREECLEAATPCRLERLAIPVERDRALTSSVKWAPLFLTLAAGSLAIWPGKKPAPQRRPAAPPADAMPISLRDAPGLADAPWVQTRDDGVRRELQFRGADGKAMLREDRDGDGVFEREYTVEVE